MGNVGISVVQIHLLTYQMVLLCALQDPDNLYFSFTKLLSENETRRGNILGSNTWNFFFPEMEFLWNAHCDAAPFTALQLQALKRRSSEGQKSFAFCSPLLQPGSCGTRSFVFPSVASPLLLAPSAGEFWPLLWGF